MDGFYQGPSRGPTEIFFREGRPDQWKYELSTDLASAMSKACGSLMDALKFERVGASP
jgi:hypothetical protein